MDGKVSMVFNRNFSWLGALQAVTHTVKVVVSKKWYETDSWRIVVSGVRRMNEVNLCRARLVLGWVTVFGRVYHLGM